MRPGAVLQALLEHDDLADVAVARAMARERAVQFALLLAMLPPEVQTEHGAGEDDEPGHGRHESKTEDAQRSSSRCGKR